MNDIVIILVEDDPIQAQVYIQLLEDIGGFHVLWDRTAARGLNRLAQFTPNILICDLNLEQEGGGFDVLARAVEKRIPTVVISNRLSLNADQLRSIKSGAVVYLHKSFGPEMLISTINNLLEAFKLKADRQSLPGGITLDYSRKEVKYNDLPPVFLGIGIEILHILWNQTDNFSSSKSLAERIYGLNDLKSREALKSNIFRLKKKLQDKGIPIVLSSEKGRGKGGYKLTLNQ